MSRSRLVENESPPVRVVALFFDDARLEVTGKAILIGQYTSEIGIHDPLLLDRLCVFLDIRWPRDYQPSNLTVRVDIPSQPLPVETELMVPAPLDYSNKPQSPFSGAVMQGVVQLRFPPLRYNDNIDVWVTVDGHRFAAGRVTIVPPKPPAPSLAAAV